MVETQCGVNLIPADISLAKGEKEILGEIGNTGFLKRKLAPLRGKFDNILIDCPPSLGLLTINALAAADTVLIPVQCQFFALEGLRQLLETIKGIRNREVNPQLQILIKYLTREKYYYHSRCACHPQYYANRNQSF